MDLVERLKKEPVKNVKFTKDFISFEYDGKKIRNIIIIEKHQKFVGRWDKILNVVYLDDDLKGLDLEAVALHESIEKYVSQKYGLKPFEEAHEIATVKEREYMERKKGNWASHQIKAGIIWKKEAAKSG